MHKDAMMPVGDHNFPSIFNRRILSFLSQESRRYGSVNPLYWAIRTTTRRRPWGRSPLRIAGWLGPPLAVSLIIACGGNASSSPSTVRLGADPAFAERALAIAQASLPPR